jgi:sec-independent protein translocase protein TatA
MPLGGLGMGEIILIFLVVLLLFGAKRLPEIGSALGKGIREFKGSVREIEGELKAPLEDIKSVPPKASNDQDKGPKRLTVTDEEQAD